MQCSKRFRVTFVYLPKLPFYHVPFLLVQFTSSHYMSLLYFALLLWQFYASTPSSKQPLVYFLLLFWQIQDLHPKSQVQLFRVVHRIMQLCFLPTPSLNLSLSLGALLRPLSVLGVFPPSLILSSTFVFYSPRSYVDSVSPCPSIFLGYAISPYSHSVTFGHTDFSTTTGDLFLDIPRMILSRHFSLVFISSNWAHPQFFSQYCDTRHFEYPVCIFSCFHLCCFQLLRRLRVPFPQFS